MSLPAPQLDDRTFQELVDEAKRRVRRHCPEWTDHNVSDPGVTLIELFAWMTELTLYRLNQVPERNYIKFLELLGVTLTSPTPAQVELDFRLSRPIWDRDGEEGWERTLKAYETVAATVRTETNEAIEFATTRDLTIRRPRLAYLLASAAPEGGQTEPDWNAARSLSLLPPAEDATADTAPATAATEDTAALRFAVFSQPPRLDDAFYVGFAGDLSSVIVSLDATCIRAAAPNLVEEYPSQIWESWNGAAGRWETLTPLADTTFGWNRTGRIEIALPTDTLQPQTLGERTAYWIRCRYTTRPNEMPPRPPVSSGNGGADLSDDRTLLRPGTYLRSPEIRGMRVRALGGAVWASNCATVFDEYVGRSDGIAGQCFTLKNRNLLPRTPEETIWVGDTGADETGATNDGPWEVWQERPNFARSGPDDRHFTLDSATGEVCFGPHVRQPDGSYRQHGAIPDRGRRLLFRRYRHGGGIGGNVRENQISVVKSALPYVREVTNPRRATGGADRETLQRAVFRAQAQIQQRERAVTAADFEALAEQVSGVGRARCLHPERIYSANSSDETRIAPGTVRVLLVPRLGGDVHTPQPRDLHVPDPTRQAVERYLDRCRLLTTVLDVGTPRYVFISTDITLVADPRHEPSAVAQRVRDALAAFLHPLTGGPQRTGWPFRRALTLADIYAQVQAAQGVAFLLEARLFRSQAVGDGDRLSAETAIDPARGFLPDADTLLCTREHRIQVRSLAQYGQEDARA